MIVPLDLRDVLLLVGIGNGLLMLIYLIGNRERTTAKILLGLLIFCLTFNVSIFLVLKYEIYNKYPFLHWLPFGLSFILGPLLFFYAKAIVSNSFKLGTSTYKHFLLLLLDYPHSIYHLIYGREVLHLNLHYVLDKFALFSLIPSAIYLLYTYRMVREYNHQLPNYASNTRNLQLKWLGDSIIIWTGLFVIVLIYGTIDFVVDLNFEEAYFTNFLFVFTIIWLGVKGLKQGQSSVDFSKQVVQPIAVERGNEIITELTHLMDSQKLHLFPDLTLRSVENQMDFSSKEISLAINQILHKNFYQFVNEYRVEEFKRRVLNPSYNYLTLFGIAQDSGFNSKATFNRVFKNSTGISPREFLDKSQSERSQ